MPLCVRCQCLNQYDRHVHVTRLSKILVFQFASLSFLLAFSAPAVSKCFRGDSLRSECRLLSGVRVASYAQALQGLRTETCGCGTLRIGKACRLSLATRSSSRICVMNPPSVTSVVSWFSHHTHFRSIRDASASLVKSSRSCGGTPSTARRIHGARQSCACNDDCFQNEVAHSTHHCIQDVVQM